MSSTLGADAESTDAALNPHADDDAELVRRASEGDPRAFDGLVRRHLRRAVAVAWEFTASLDEAEDLVQEGFLRALEGLSEFDIERPFAPWFFTILRNLGRNHASTRGRWAYIPLESESGDARGFGGELEASEPAADLALEQRAMAERVAAAVETLPPMQRACLRLRDLEGFTGAEVAEMLGIGESTARVHLHRARRALRPLLEPLRDEVR